MGYDLIGKKGATFCAGNWGHLLELAKSFGWRAEGTLFPTCNEDQGALYIEGDERWNGNYFGNDWQRVSQTNSAAMAVAVRKALEAHTELTLGADPILDARQHNCLLWLNTLSPNELDWVRAFADFCELGGFMIA